MDEERRAIVRARLTKAEGKIAAARADLDAGRYDEAASRAYYAMFHRARAMPAAKALRARSHSGLAAVFGEHLFRSGDVDAQLGRWLGQGRRTREIGDDDDFLAIEEDEASECVSRAAPFVDEARRWLATRGAQPTRVERTINAIPIRGFEHASRIAAETRRPRNVRRRVHDAVVAADERNPAPPPGVDITKSEDCGAQSLQ